jgi:hypothetical protein
MGALGKPRGDAALNSEAPAFAQPLRRSRLNPKSEIHPPKAGKNENNQNSNDQDQLKPK